MAIFINMGSNIIKLSETEMRLDILSADEELISKYTNEAGEISPYEENTFEFKLSNVNTSLNFEDIIDDFKKRHPYTEDLNELLSLNKEYLFYIIFLSYVNKLTTQDIKDFLELSTNVSRESFILNRLLPFNGNGVITFKLFDSFKNTISKSQKFSKNIYTRMHTATKNQISLKASDIAQSFSRYKYGLSTVDIDNENSARINSLFFSTGFGSEVAWKSFYCTNSNAFDKDLYDDDKNKKIYFDYIRPTVYNKYLLNSSLNKFEKLSSIEKATIEPNFITDKNIVDDIFRTTILDSIIRKDKPWLTRDKLWEAIPGITSFDKIYPYDSIDFGINYLMNITNREYVADANYNRFKQIGQTLLINTTKPKENATIKNPNFNPRTLYYANKEGNEYGLELLNNNMPKCDYIKNRTITYSDETSINEYYKDHPNTDLSEVQTLYNKIISFTKSMNENYNEYLKDSDFLNDTNRKNFFKNVIYNSYLKNNINSFLGNNYGSDSSNHPGRTAVRNLMEVVLKDVIAPIIFYLVDPDTQMYLHYKTIGYLKFIEDNKNYDEYNEIYETRLDINYETRVDIIENKIHQLKVNIEYFIQNFMNMDIVIVKENGKYLIKSLGTDNYINEFSYFLDTFTQLNNRYEDYNTLIELFNNDLTNEAGKNIYTLAQEYINILSESYDDRISSRTALRQEFYFLVYFDLYCHYIDFLNNPEETEFTFEVSKATYLIYKAIFILRESIIDMDYVNQIVESFKSYQYEISKPVFTPAVTTSSSSSITSALPTTNTNSSSNSNSTYTTTAKTSTNTASTLPTSTGTQTDSGSIAQKINDNRIATYAKDMF